MSRGIVREAFGLVARAVAATTAAIAAAGGGSSGWSRRRSTAATRCCQTDGVRRRVDPARRHGRVLRVGRAAAPARARRPAGRRRRHRPPRRRRRGVVRGAALRRVLGDAVGRAPGSCARRRCSCRATTTPTPRPAPGASRSSSRYTPLVEPLSLDEAFLDVTGAGRPVRRRRRRSAAASAPRSPTELGADVLGRRRAEQVPRQDGVGRGQAAGPTRTASSPGPACSRCDPGEEVAYLHPLPVRRLWGVGPATLRAAQPARASTPSATSPPSRPVALRGSARPGASADPPARPRRRRSTTGPSRASGR